MLVRDGESSKSAFFRLFLNRYPAYRGSGGRVRYIASDWREVRVELPLSWRTRNNAGVIFGGSIYAAIDPFYALMLGKNLGPEYVVWDKAAKIRYRRPGESRLYARFTLSGAEADEVRTLLEGQRSIDRVYTVRLVDAEGDVKAVVEKTVYAAKSARKDAPPKETKREVVREVVEHKEAG